MSLVAYALSSDSESDADARDGPPPTAGHKRPAQNNDASPTLPSPKRVCAGTRTHAKEDTSERAAPARPVRCFPHAEGAWALHVYVPVALSPAATEVLASFVRDAAAATPGVVAVPPAEYHVSVSRTVPVRYPSIGPIADKVASAVRGIAAFDACLGTLARLLNDNGTRAFVGATVARGKDGFAKLAARVDEVFRAHGLEEYYAEGSFHVSVAWVAAASFPVLADDVTEDFEHAAAACGWLPFAATRVCVRAGNKVFDCPLGPAG